MVYVRKDFEHKYGSNASKFYGVYKKLVTFGAYSFSFKENQKFDGSWVITTQTLSFILHSTESSITFFHKKFYEPGNSYSSSVYVLQIKEKRYEYDTMSSLIKGLTEHCNWKEAMNE